MPPELIANAADDCLRMLPRARAAFQELDPVRVQAGPSSQSKGKNKANNAPKK
jgi:hypothetical protein